MVCAGRVEHTPCKEEQKAVGRKMQWKLRPPSPSDLMLLPGLSRIRPANNPSTASPPAGPALQPAAKRVAAVEPSASARLKPDGCHIPQAEADRHLQYASSGLPQTEAGMNPQQAVSEKPQARAGSSGRAADAVVPQSSTASALLKLKGQGALRQKRQPLKRAFGGDSGSDSDGIEFFMDITSDKENVGSDQAKLAAVPAEAALSDGQQCSNAKVATFTLLLLRVSCLCR